MKIIFIFLKENILLSTAYVNNVNNKNFVLE